MTYLHEQLDATNLLPSDQTLSSSGSATSSATGAWSSTRPTAPPVHAPWALAINARLRERYGVDGQAVASDDGIVVRIPDTDAEPPGMATSSSSSPTRSRPSSPTRSAGPRCSRAGSVSAPPGPCCSPPRPRPPLALWQQRQRSAVLLEVAVEVSLLPDRARDGPRGASGRLRPAGAGRPHARVDQREVTVVDGRRPSPRRSPAACSSGTSPSSCTRATP